MSEVEIRNDLSGNAILDGTPPAAVRALADEAGVTIISINALQRFNEWTAAREREAIELADYAKACGASALVLVPVNDGSGRANGERQGNLRVALKALKPILSSRGITGLVEPLGFEICSLRSKQEAADAIRAVDARLQQAEATQHEVARVQRPALGEQSVVVGIEVGELAVARGGDPGGVVPFRGLLAAAPRELHQLVGADHLVLEPVDARDEAGQQRRRVATDLVLAQCQLAELVEQERHPVGRAHGGEVGIEAGLGRLVAQ